MKATTNSNIFKIHNPRSFYAHHKPFLDRAGARAFGRTVEAFGPDVADHFAEAEFAHIMTQGRRKITGFALYKMLGTRLWRRCAA